MSFFNKIMCRDHQARFTRKLQTRGKFRGIGSKNNILLLTWQFIISFSLSATVMDTVLQKNHGKYYFPWVVEGEFSLGLIVLTITMPVVILLAEVVISRYKLLSYSLRVMWLISIADCIISVTWPTAYLTIKIILVVVPKYLVFGVCLGNAVQLGIDQITVGTDANISAYVQWLLWATFSGSTLPLMIVASVTSCTNWQLSSINMIIPLMPVIMLSVGLILDFFLSHRLVQEPVTDNPVTLIFKVLKFAAKHKHPVRRSAFTYCENELPSRLDNGKSKYGGPFTTEQVEDVKTFWRILLVIFVMTMVSIPLTMDVEVSRHKTYYNYKKGILHKVLQPNYMVAYLIPLYELLVYPCLRNRGPRILQSVGIGAAALLLSSLYGLTAETVRYITSHGTTQCLFTASDICFFTYIPHNFLVGFATAVLYKTGIEFICAQAPYNMKGFILGIAFTSLMVFTIPAFLLYGIWKRWIGKMDPSKTAIWFYLTTTVLIVALSLILYCVIRRYKPRERDETTSSQNMVEEIYHKYQEQEASQDFS